MKKKKLKKKIEKLEQQVVDMYNAQNTVLHNLRDRCSTLSDAIDAEVHSYKSEFGTVKQSVREIRNKVIRLENDNKYYKEWIDTAPCYRCTNSKGENEKTCDTCRWKPLMERGGQDIPCMGCTADDKKMWKSNEEQNNGN